jgi:hypothetical protein
VGALAAAMEGEVGADAIVCDAAQGSTENEDNANSKFRFNELFIILTKGMEYRTRLALKARMRSGAA